MALLSNQGARQGAKRAAVADGTDRSRSSSAMLGQARMNRIIPRLDVCSVTVPIGAARTPLHPCDVPR